ncbi:MAG: fructose-bisphosphatase class III, partial [Firmicutes bacterium]|nr:fructose-bisphosphatase class III [Bacillota bacterium]
MTYVIGDIHGEYDQLMILMEMIAPKDGDVIYALGDVIDRGPEPVKVVRYLMEHPNLRLIAGNHELMALECLHFLMQDITEDSIAGINETDLALLADWQINGCASTLKGLRALTTEERSDVIEYLSDALAYEDIEVEGVRYILVHGGLGNYRPDRPLWDYS